MLKRVLRPAAVCALLFLAVTTAQAQSPSPEALTAAKELIKTMNLAEQFKAMFPVIINGLKPAIVQGRAEVARDYDAMMPTMTDAFMKRFDEMSDGVATIYASNFSTEDLHMMTAFYKTPTGQKVLQKTPSLAAQTMALGQSWGKAAAEDLRARMIEEMRKKGHSL